MKRYLISILAILVLASGLLVGCSNPERDQAIKFYSQLYPMSQEIHQIVNEWNSWNLQASQKEYQQNLYNKATSYKDKLRALSYKIVALSAPQGLRDLKDFTVSAVNQGIESFSYAEDYALNPYNENYRLKAESAQLEFNRLLGLAADEWDSGLTRYNVKSSDIAR